MAEKYQLTLEDLQRERLEAFYANKENDTHFTLEQKKFLTRLAAASGIANEIEDEYKETVFELMARIGSAQNLKKWLEAKEISWFSLNRALEAAASNGHLDCVTCLMEEYGQGVSASCKGWALHEAANNGHLDCVTYLMEVCGQDISDNDKKEARAAARKNGHEEVAQYLDNNNASFDKILAFIFPSIIGIGSQKRKREENNMKESKENENNPSSRYCSFM